ncbi:MAG: cysteine--tRNA ligase [Oscillospiraceae bacterium]|jgi:cysteinyl-tRNA synthetase|nr:cysteine--tRNA ligase [Oscillospiraceae bacterium]
MTLYNTLTRRKETFAPIAAAAGLYACGPTVYSPAHIGNMRSYLFTDWLRRALIFGGYTPKHVMNITDVGHLTDDGDAGEDKLQKAAREKKLDPWAIAASVTARFFADADALNIQRPEVVCKATDHIPQMIAFVEGLLEKGHGYETSDGIYFDIATFPGYGKLSRLDLDAQVAGARVEVNPEKRNPFDFALWKKAPREHIMQWDSPWGKGYPGWHIECSAMGLQYLGERFDIHTGGIDHLPVHHENEIAQDEALLGHPMVNTWMHGEFLLIDGGKMSKSLGNLYTLGDLEERGYPPMAYRYFCAGAHYRSKLNFTWDGMDAAKTAYNRLLAAVRAHRGGTGNASVEPYAAQMRDAVLDDLNIPKAVGALWTMARQPERTQAVYDAALAIDRVLGLRLDDAGPAAGQSGPDTLPEGIRALVDARQAAKANRDYPEADRIRGELKGLGYELTDTKEGVVCKKIS